MADEVYGLSSSDRDKLIAGMHAGNDAMRRLNHSGTGPKGFQTTTLLIGEATKAMVAGDIEDFKRVTGDHEETVEPYGVVKAKLLYGSVEKEEKVFLILLERFLWYAIPQSGSGETKYFTLDAELTDCATVAGTEVKVLLAGGCLNTEAISPTVTATLHETSYLVSRHNIARNIKLDTPIPAGTVVEAKAFPSEPPASESEEPPPKTWRIVELLDCECPAVAPTPWCNIIGGVDLSELSTSADAVYGLALDATNCLVREQRGCEYFSGQYINDIPTGTPEFVIGISADGCLCKVPVAPCIPTPATTDPPPTDPPPTDPPYSPGGGG